jgi:hypothetical protein
VPTLSKVLAELDKFDLAIRLALVHDESPAYALTLLLLRTKDISEVERYLSSLPSPILVDLCQNLIAIKEPLPESLVN